MNIAELFVSLGVKGSEKTIGAVANLSKGLAVSAGNALELSAGLGVAFYAFDRLTSGSNTAGQSLRNFETLTGVSADTLQRYQYAARQAGVSNEETAGSFKALQAAMGAVARNEGAPAGMKFISGLVGGFDIKRIQSQP